MDSRSITLSTEISFWTQYRATRAILGRLKSTLFGWSFFVGVPFLFILSMLLLGKDIFAPGIFGLPIWTLLLFGVLYMVCLIPLTQMLNVSGMRRRNPSVGGLQTYTINQEGYSVRGSLFDTTLKWNAFLKAVENNEFILLYISTRWAHLIPKTAASGAEINVIRAILKEQLGPKAKLKDG
jgi:YcxB-like protein